VKKYVHDMILILKDVGWKASKVFLVDKKTQFILIK